MPGTYPHRYLPLLEPEFERDLAEPLARSYFDALHTGDDIFLFEIAVCGQFRHNVAEALRRNGNEHDVSRADGARKVVGQRDRARERDVFVLARHGELFVTDRAAPAAKRNVVSELRRIPCQKRTPSAAADDGHLCARTRIVNGNRILFEQFTTCFR